MEIILNDFSLDGQFKSLDNDFLEYFRWDLLPVLDIANKKELRFLKRTDFYSRKITQSESVHDLLKQSNNPIATLWKRYIIQMAYSEPYWDNELASKRDIVYQYPIDAEMPNCFTEAMERKISLFSFPHENFRNGIILCHRDGVGVGVCNIFEVRQLLLTYLRLHSKEIRFVMENYPYSNERRVRFAVVEGKCYAEEALLENDLDYEDYEKIITCIPELVENLLNGKKSKLWDGFGEGLFEYRMNVSSDRIFRLFFIQKSEEIFFLNGFIKKTQATPQQELSKARRIKRMI